MAKRLAKLKDDHQADKYLQVFYDLDRQIVKMEKDRGKKIAAIRMKVRDESKELREQRAALKTALRLYAEKNVQIDGDERTLELPSGKIGFRKVPRVIVGSKTLEKLAEQGMRHCINKPKAKVLKSVLATYDETDLKKVGVRKQEVDHFQIKEKD